MSAGPAEVTGLTPSVAYAQQLAAAAGLHSPAGNEDVHPAWCERARCTLDPDRPLDDGQHLSTPVEIDVPISGTGPVSLDAWLHQNAAGGEAYLVVDVLDAGRAMMPVPAATAAAAALTRLLEQAAPVTYTHPDVLDAGVRDGWADPETNPARIDWTPRQAAAALPFRVVDGRPVNPHAPTGIRYGRNQLGHWGEALAADAVITAGLNTGGRVLLMIERGERHGWALPGGMVEPGESPPAAAIRELAKETGLHLPGQDGAWKTLFPQYVPDPRASDEAWIVTAPSRLHLGQFTDAQQLPTVTGRDDAARAAWVRADTYQQLTANLAGLDGGQVFAAHTTLLSDLLDDEPDPGSCPHCGAPTGGPPCSTSFAGGPSCADVIAEGRRDW